MEYVPIKKSSFSWKEREYIFGASRISLCQEDDGKPAWDYLLRKRNLDVETIAAFRLGYVPPRVKGKAWQLRGRIIMPIFDIYGRLLALSARPLGDCPEQKYWNEAFHKAEHLYGMDLAKYHIVENDFVVIVEGQFDTMSMYSHGIRNVVGLCGGALSPIHVCMIRRLTKNIVLIMDGDKAGKRHAESADELFECFLKRNPKRGSYANRLNYVKVVLDGGADPDEFLSLHGGMGMKDLIRRLAASKLNVDRGWLNGE